MKKLIILLIAMAFMLAASSAFALQATSNLTVTASVTNGCSITSVANIDFGTYDPTSGTPKDANGNFVFRCTKGTVYDLYITGARTMSNGTDNLTYELYQDAPRTTLWPIASPGVSGTTPSNANITKDIYGRVTAGQDVSAGSYTSTVVVTVQY